VKFDVLIPVIANTNHEGTLFHYLLHKNWIWAVSHAKRAPFWKEKASWLTRSHIMIMYATLSLIII